MFAFQIKNSEGNMFFRLLKKCEHPGTIIFFSLFILLAGMAVAKYHSLHSTFADLGMFLTHFSKPPDELWRNFVGHARPLMPIWSFLYQLLPENWVPAVILSAQAGALAWPVAGLYRHFGIIPVLAFTLFFPLWYNALFDFHMAHLAVPILFGFFFLERSGRIWSAVFLALFLALVSEPFALQTVACGLYMLVIRKHRLAGFILILGGLSYFFIATHYLIPYFSMGERGGLDSSAFSWLGHSLTDMILFILTKPHIVLAEIISDNAKILYLFCIFGSLAFIPLLRPGILIVALPVIAIALLSRVGNYTGLYYHYTAGLIAPLIMAFAEGLPTARKIWSRLSFQKIPFIPLLFICPLAIHIPLAPSPLSYTFLVKDSWAYSYRAYIPTQRDKMIKEAIHLHVPSEPEVAVSAQNTVNWGYLADRNNYLPFPMGVLEPHRVLMGTNRSLAGLWEFIKTGKMTKAKTKRIWADYVVLDLKRPWFINDQGCSWKNGQCKNKGEFTSKFLALTQRTKELFNTVFEKDGFFVLARKKRLSQTP
jgi:uncharacterized membrane protein